MSVKFEQLTEKYASCPVSPAVYEENGAIFTVTRHFTGDKNINKTVAELAVSQANREMGFN